MKEQGGRIALQRVMNQFGGFDGAGIGGCDTDLNAGAVIEHILGKFELNFVRCRHA